MKPAAKKPARKTRKAAPRPGIEPRPGQWMHPKEFSAVVRLTPLVSIDLILRSSDGRILVGHRKHEPAKGTYFVPGGRISKNETRAAAFKRLTRDELGVERPIHDARFLGVYEHFYPANRYEEKGFGTHYVVLAYELDMDLPVAALPKDQHGNYVWMTEAEILAAPDVHPNTREYLSVKPRRRRL